MITNDDIIEFCELTPEQIEVIAECTHEPWTPCIAHIESLINGDNGIEMIYLYFDESIQRAKLKGDYRHMRTLKRVYNAFKRAHA